MPTDPRFYDFDAAFAEQQPIPFRLLGQEWQLPATCPAATILRSQRLMLTMAQLEADDENLPDDFVIDDDLSYEKMCREMVGDQLMDQWLDLGISYQMLEAVTRRLYAIYTGNDPDAESGKARKKPADRKRASRSKRS